MEHITDKITPTLEDVCAWGYDEDLFFMEQDEDLLLYGFEYVPVLLQLAADLVCPKREYIFHILCQFCREMFLAGRPENLHDLEQCLGLTSEADEGPVGWWASYVRRLLSYRNRSFAVDKQMALAMGEDLLLGPGRFAMVRLTERVLSQWWELSLTTSVPIEMSPSSIREYLYISKTMGVFRYRSYNPYTEAELGSPAA